MAERIAGQHGHVNFNTIPWVIYTAPGDRLGRPDRAAAEGGGPRLQGRHLPVHRPTAARARWATPTGLVKFLADATTDEILGVHIIGPMAGELIAEAVLATRSIRRAPRTCSAPIHAHPTLSEALHEAALDADKRAIDIPNR
ncbi:MAG: hypothetical protein MZW92_34105 [Comamonadaceae bacterium]|nr:hypothetical protein [Comamonadaceae bacterium]